MTATKKLSNPKRQRVIPVKVTVDHRPAPTNLPPLASVTIAPSRPKPPSPSFKEQVKKSPPVRVMRLPVHEWSEARRQRLMWWLVGGSMAVVVITWLGLIRTELSGGSQGSNLFSEASQLLRSVRWPGTAQPSAAEKEQRQLDQQVFPQFQP